MHFNGGLRTTKVKYGWRNPTLEILKIQDGERSKVKKSRYLKNHLTNFIEICYADAY